MKRHHGAAIRTRDLVKRQESSPPLYDRYWSEKYSIIAQSMTKREKSCQEIIQEVLKGEEQLTNKLDKFIRVYKRTIESFRPIPQDKIEILFYNIEKILNLHRHLMAKVEQRRHEVTGRIDCFGEVYSKWILDINFEEIYLGYISNLVSARDLYERGLDDTRFNEIIGKLDQSKKINKKHGFWDFVDAPRSRLFNYKLLIKRLLEKLEKDHPDYQHVQTCVLNLEEIMVKCDEATAKQNLEFFQKRIFAGKNQTNNLTRFLDSATELINQGTMTVKSSPKDFVNEKRCHAFLFDSGLALTIDKSSSKNRRKLSTNRKDNRNNPHHEMDNVEQFELIKFPMEICFIEVEKKERDDRKMILRYSPRKVPRRTESNLSTASKISKASSVSTNSQYYNTVASKSSISSSSSMYDVQIMCDDPLALSENTTTPNHNQTTNNIHTQISHPPNFFTHNSALTSSNPQIHSNSHLLTQARTLPSSHSTHHSRQSSQSSTPSKTSGFFNFMRRTPSTINDKSIKSYHDNHQARNTLPETKAVNNPKTNNLKSYTFTFNLDEAGNCNHWMEKFEKAILKSKTRILEPRNSISQAISEKTREIESLNSEIVACDDITPVEVIQNSPRFTHPSFTPSRDSHNRPNGVAMPKTSVEKSLPNQPDNMKLFTEYREKMVRQHSMEIADLEIITRSTPNINGNSQSMISLSDAGVETGDSSMDSVVNANSNVVYVKSKSMYVIGKEGETTKDSQRSVPSETVPSESVPSESMPSESIPSGSIPSESCPSSAKTSFSSTNSQKIERRVNETLDNMIDSDVEIDFSDSKCKNVVSNSSPVIRFGSLKSTKGVNVSRSTSSSTTTTESSLKSSVRTASSDDVCDADQSASSLKMPGNGNASMLSSIESELDQDDFDQDRLRHERDVDELAVTLRGLNKSQSSGCEAAVVARKKKASMGSLNRRPTTSDTSDNDAESVIPRGMKKSSCTVMFWNSENG